MFGAIAKSTEWNAQRTGSSASEARRKPNRDLLIQRGCVFMPVATFRAAAALCEADEWWSSSAGQQATWCFIRHEWDWFQVVIKLSKCRVPPPELSSSIERKSFHSNLLTKLKFSCRCGFTALCHPSFVKKLMMIKLRVATPSVEVNSLNLYFFFSPSRQKTMDRNFIVMQIYRISHFSWCWSSVGYYRFFCGPKFEFSQTRQKRSRLVIFPYESNSVLNPH